MKVVEELNESGALRQLAVRRLEARGYTVSNRARGSGSPPWSRVEATNCGERLNVVIKVVTKPQGRIHFTPEKDGSWKALHEATHVLHVWLDPDDHRTVRISLFDVATIIKAFDANYAAMKRKRGAEEPLPCWLSPEFEDGWRFTGSGFWKDAIWSETVPLNPDPDHAVDKPSAPAPRPSYEGGIMDRIKAMLAEHMGVRAERIEVEVRVKP